MLALLADEEGNVVDAKIVNDYNEYQQLSEKARNATGGDYDWVLVNWSPYTLEDYRIAAYGN